MILRNCRLIAALTEGYEGDFADLHIAGNTILDIQEPGKLRAENEEELDLAGRTLLPAFFDMHCHLCYDALSDYTAMNDKEEAYTCMDAYRFAQAYLKQGFTTLRDAGTLHNVTVKLMKMREKGTIEWIPDILSSCCALTPTAPGNSEYKEMYEVCDGPVEVRKAARKQFEAGADMIKFMATGCYLDDSGNPGIPTATEDELRAAVEVASMRNSYVMAHAHGAEGIKNCLRAGVYTIEHGSFVDEEAIEMLKEEKSFMVPTAGIAIPFMGEDNAASEAFTDAILEKNALFERQERACVDRAYKSGLKLGFGSDIDMEDFVNTPGIEFRGRTEWYHFKPLDILLQATKNSAEILHMDNCKGTIKVGKNAELVAVSGAPEEDIAVMYRMPDYVFYHDQIICNVE